MSEQLLKTDKTELMQLIGVILRDDPLTDRQLAIICHVASSERARRTVSISRDIDPSRAQPSSPKPV